MFNIPMCKLRKSYNGNGPIIDDLAMGTTRLTGWMQPVAAKPSNSKYQMIGIIKHHGVSLPSPLIELAA